jgi:hypothetical protein
MNQATEFFDAIDTLADRETAAMIEYYMRRLPKKYSTADKARIRVLTQHIRSRGAGLEEALGIARKHVEQNPLQSVVEDLRSRFWESPYPSSANAKVLAMLAKRDQLENITDRTAA